MRKLFTFLVISVFFANVAYADETKTIQLSKESAVVSLVFNPELVYDSTNRGYHYEANFDIQWGGYSQSFGSWLRKIHKDTEHPVIVRFSDIQGAGYPMTITTKGKTKFIAHHQGTSEKDLRTWYYGVTILNCGSTIRC